MTRHGKFLVRLLSGSADQALRFDELRALLRRLEFAERHRGGSHHSHTRDGVAEILNLQPRGGGEAKAYHLSGEAGPGHFLALSAGSATTQ